nr:homeobox-leucine zipper protein HOX4-like [Ipomoea batatas]
MKAKLNGESKGWVKEEGMESEGNDGKPNSDEIELYGGFQRRVIGQRFQRDSERGNQQLPLVRGVLDIPRTLHGLFQIPGAF